MLDANRADTTWRNRRNEYDMGRLSVDVMLTPGIASVVFVFL